eukprot:1149551-Pyramimonas_sp.AAC.1
MPSASTRRRSLCTRWRMRPMMQLLSCADSSPLKLMRLEAVEASATTVAPCPPAAPCEAGRRGGAACCGAWATENRGRSAQG